MEAIENIENMYVFTPINPGLTPIYCTQKSTYHYICGIDTILRDMKTLQGNSGTVSSGSNPLPPAFYMAVVRHIAPIVGGFLLRN
jgi:hypothetical protein